MIKEKTKRLQMLEERLENKVKAAKKAADELEVIEQRAQNRAKQREKRQSDKDRYTLGLVLKFVYLKRFSMPAVKKEWILEAFPKEKPERYIECLEKHGIKVE
ncbi:hypothetical protein [Solidesulfovibrio carbinolicus]|uniref:Mobilization protein n=1 Tax=Solidesulfovibrio carbinolicus TaxID=296842 RepID=A0A4P6HVX8_9BACT|nr:hypothetical protein [Solidesulfovibrio carbinolicus]QAZ69678.1 hypothetical protein C3Y92_20595 [Solidesulfovibrio carbinolicus]